MIVIHSFIASPTHNASVDKMFAPVHAPKRSRATLPPRSPSFSSYRWFCKLGIEHKIPDHSAFSRARNERFRDSCACSKVRKPEKHWRFSHQHHTVVGMITICSALASLLSFRFRSRVALELEFVA
jgi:hypothetical protein